MKTMTVSLVITLLLAGALFAQEPDIRETKGATQREDTLTCYPNTVHAQGIREHARGPYSGPI
jgi:hypothetical protein